MCPLCDAGKQNLTLTLKDPFVMKSIKHCLYTVLLTAGLCNTFTAFYWTNIGIMGTVLSGDVQRRSFIKLQHLELLGSLFSVLCL